MTALPAALLLSALLGASAVAQTPADGKARGLTLELNSLSTPESGGCRLTYVTENHLGRDLTELTWQVAVFDRNGVVSAILGLDFGTLPDGRTRVAAFDLTGQPCDQIARIVVNDVLRCTVQGTPDDPACLDGLMLRNLTPVRFGL